MGDPFVIAPAGGEVVGDAPDRRVEILCEHDALHATWARFGPRRDGADLHVHRGHSDLFYVLEGELTVLLGPAGEAVALPAGTLARVPPLVVHGFRNASDAEVRYLNFHAPGVGFADYMRGLRDGTRRSFDQEPPPRTEAGPRRRPRSAPRQQVANVEEIAIAEVQGDQVDPSPHDHRHAASSSTCSKASSRSRPAAASCAPRRAHGCRCRRASAHAVTGPARHLSIHAPWSGLVPG